MSADDRAIIASNLTVAHYLRQILNKLNNTTVLGAGVDKDVLRVYEVYLKRREEVKRQ